MHLRVLDAVRGVAAVYVVAYHATNILWAAPPDADALTLLTRQILGFGHEAVVLFFVVSGFCIHYRQARAPEARLDLRGFAWRRARRLYPPLLLALGAASLFDGLGMRLDRRIYDSGLLYSNDHSLTTLVGNLLFQGDLSVPVWGTNGPLWSLALEFWFYVLYPFVLVSFRRIGPGRSLFLATCVSVGSTVAYRWVSTGPVWVLSEWAIWVAGAYIAELYARGAQPSLLRRLGPAVGVLVAVCLATTPRGDDVRFPDFLWGAYIAVLLAYGLLVAPPRLARVSDAAAARLKLLGDVSYSLYLLHQPWLMLLGATWLSRQPARPSGPALAAVGLATGLGIGCLGWWIAERPGHLFSRLPAHVSSWLRAGVLWRAPWSIAGTRSRAPSSSLPG